MLNQDWERFGEDIRRTVQDAIDSQDFQRLNQTITGTINSAMGGVGKSLHNMGRNFGDIAKSVTPPVTPPMTPQTTSKNVLYAPTTGAKAGGIALTTVGATLGGGMFICLCVLLVAIIMSPQPLETIFNIMGVVAGFLMIGGVVMTCFGTRQLGRVKRFRAYTKELECKEYCEIKDLTGKVNKSEKYIVKDIQRFISRGWFRQGHMDKQSTCLITSDEAYTQYTALMEHMEQVRHEEARRQEQKAMKDDKLDPQVQEILRTGDAYIQKIHECNDAIPGREISAKISRMETLIDRIFERVEQNQDNVPDVRRLMEYYLPTTVKLLEAYEQLDQQPVQGENIVSSKQEIEKTLDTLNTAFEKLLDSMFQDTAWNVSADISVLKTMLAQEGLTPDDFK